MEVDLGRRLAHEQGDRVPRLLALQLKHGDNGGSGENGGPLLGDLQGSRFAVVQAVNDGLQHVLIDALRIFGRLNPVIKGKVFNEVLDHA